MTKNRDKKHIVRDRMAKTGESYQTALRRVEAGANEPAMKKMSPSGQNWIARLQAHLRDRVRLRPIAHRALETGVPLDPIDDEWIVDDVDETGTTAILNPRTGHRYTLGSDAIEDFRSPDFLLLRLQLTLSGRSVLAEPISGASDDEGDVDMLSEEQLQLLRQLATAQQATPKGGHKEFLTASSFDGVVVILADGHTNVPLDTPDLDALVDAGLVRITHRRSHGDVNGYVTNTGVDLALTSTPPTPPASTAAAPDGIPKVFLSYAWEGDDHARWVVRLAEALTHAGVHVMFDKWDTHLGSDLPRFMEAAVREADHVLLVCTPKYAEKANARAGGVGYENLIVTGHVFQRLGAVEGKIIPILRAGDWATSRPTWTHALMTADMRDEVQFSAGVEDILRHVHKQPRHTRPPLGPRPSFAGNAGPNAPLPSGRLAELRRLLGLPAFQIASNASKRHDGTRTMDFTLAVKRLDSIPLLEPVASGLGAEEERLGNLPSRDETFRISVPFNGGETAVGELFVTFKLGSGERLRYVYRVISTWDGSAVAERQRVVLLDVTGRVIEEFGE
ncbi:MAG: toll/interleukin-1 receptor domain-containing protein [Deltaproteobacteria bacterium]|nr:toll/interleukin-1 receptor domain-containing protein [Deltaproteobacteria bacterium]